MHDVTHLRTHVQNGCTALWLACANKHEAASIWCFFSIMQIVVLVAILVMQRHVRGKWYVSDKEA